MSRLLYGLALLSVGLLLLTLFMGLQVSEGTLSGETHMVVAILAAALSIVTHFLSLRYY
ncbi:MAG: hypothetical protein HYY96_14740 [Candidatus Tectomicrobia bacterium]|nr:hypothetical protein [Candidatus Tectomicrobia bacterium]